MEIFKDHRRLHTCVHIILVFGLLFTLLGSPKVPEARALGTRNENAFINCAAQTQIPEAECDALVAFYNSTSGPNWTDHTGWLQTDTTCDWYGIICTANTVTELELFENNLVGTIPPELGNLRNLQVLYLGVPEAISINPQTHPGSHRSNQLSGAIPPELGNLAHLSFLVLSDNLFSGAIPPELGKLTNLNTLALENNQLSGAIPPELGNLTNLEMLGLEGNQLSGIIPPELGYLHHLGILALSNNRLSGPIPAGLGNLGSLFYLVLNNNRLSEPIPAQLGSLSSLQLLILSDNQLSGPIPPELGNMTGLMWLYLHHNRMSGEFPTSITSLTNLETFKFDCWISSTNLSVITFIDALVPGWQSKICPVVSSINRSYANPTHLASVDFTVTFSKSVEGVTVDDFDLYTTGLAGASITGMTGMGDTYAVTVKTGSGNGNIRLDVVDDNSILGATGNSLGGPAPGDGSFTSGQSYRVIKTPNFSDVPETHPYWEDIETLYANGLSAGCQASPLKFCPDQVMNRGQAAVFVLRGNFGSSYVPPVPAHFFKDDWTRGPWAESWAEGMRNKGFSAGCLTNPLKYCPWDQIPASRPSSSRCA